MNKWLVRIGLAVTALYVGLGAWLLGDELAAIHGLKLNELGDFLAGVFGPLALLWLILGFFQQGIELRQTRETLALQAKELRFSVEQQKQLVDVARKQFESETVSRKHEMALSLSSIRPRFVFSERANVINIGPEYSPSYMPVKGEPDTMYVRLENRGAVPRNLRVEVEGSVECDIHRYLNLLESHGKCDFEVMLLDASDSEFALHFDYTDGVGDDRRDSFVFRSEPSEEKLSFTWRSKE